MSVSVRDLKTYTSFARRFAGKFVRDRFEESHVPLLPAPHKPRPAEWSDERLTVSWLGHATVLINFFGTWLLTDPALRPHVGLRIAGVAIRRCRGVMCAVSANDHAPRHAFSVSLAHMDHYRLVTVRRLPCRID